MNDRPAPGLADRLRAIVGERGLVRDEHEKAPFETDWRGQYHGRAAAVVKPASTDEVVRVVTLLAQERIAMVPQGGDGFGRLLLGTNTIDDKVPLFIGEFFGNAETNAA